MGGVSVAWAAGGCAVCAIVLWWRGVGGGRGGGWGGGGVGTGGGGLGGGVRGGEPKPYFLRLEEDNPNPPYRRVCYTFAWSAVLCFALMNLSGLVIAMASGVWYMKQIYQYAYFPVCGTVLLLGAMGVLPRVGRSTKGEGAERRDFFGSGWAVEGGTGLL